MVGSQRSLKGVNANAHCEAIGEGSVMLTRIGRGRCSQKTQLGRQGQRIELQRSEPQRIERQSKMTESWRETGRN